MPETAERPIKQQKKKDLEIQFIPSGSTLLDLTLGGGWALGRVFNVVGDKAVGKTLIGIEAFANFSRKYPKGRMRYAEAESAFDDYFAEQLGFPDNVERPETQIHTVTEFYIDLAKFADKDGPGLYILDSLDALATDEDVERMQARIENRKEKGSMGAEKAKDMSQLFRDLVQKCQQSNCTLGIISQLRDKIGVTFGETQTRSGGRALDFYASQVLWLHNHGRIEKQVSGEKRVVGLSIHSKVKKCKVGYPFREADYDLIFGYGADDEMSMLEWLKVGGHYDEATYKDLKTKVLKAREKQDYEALKQVSKILIEDTQRTWNEIEKSVQPIVRKYV